MKRILLVEDNPGDQNLVKEAFKNEGKNLLLDTVDDGVEALDFLRRRGPYEQAQKPDLIILDLNLPRKDGREVLQEIKNDDNLKRIPVLILTTSQAEQDIRTCYELHANSYFIKPNLFNEFLQIVGKIKDYWLTHVKLSA